MDPLPRRCRTVFVVLLLALVVAPVSASAREPSPGSLDSARSRVLELDHELTDLEAQRDATLHQLGELESALATANLGVQEAEDRAAAADTAARAAEDDARHARAELAATRQALLEHQERLISFARETYKHGPDRTIPQVAALAGLGRSTDPGAIGDTVYLLEVVLGDQAGLVDRTTRLVERDAQLATRANALAAASAADAAAAADARDEAAEQHARAMALTDEADRALARLERALTDLQAQRTAARQEVSTLEERRRAAERRAAAGTTSGGVDGGLVTVGGITVAASLAPQLEALLAAARADGIVLGGSGYRSPEMTARLRRINGCPDVDRSPASACRVPTARPGESMHERGSAIDFTWQGRTICFPRPASACQGNAAFDWLAANAATYGLQVLPSEAWHWSTNGR